jgi:hypothetical protein
MAEKVRSPKYPIMGLASAIEKLRNLYDREKTASVNTDVAVKAWGYSGLSGPALQTISTLTQFGLIERAGKQKIKISELGLDILLPKTPDDKLRAIHTASSRPAIFRELMSEYLKDLPSEETLKAYLMRRSAPYIEESAKKIIKAFKETQDQLNLPEMKGFKEKEEKANEKEEKAAANLFNLAMGLGSPPPVPPLSSSPPKTKESDFAISIPLKGRVATLIFPNGEPTIKDLDTIKEFMDFYKKIISEEEPKE